MPQFTIVYITPTRVSATARTIAVMIQKSICYLTVARRIGLIFGRNGASDGSVWARSEI